MAALRRELKWALGGTVLMTAAALWWPQEGAVVRPLDTHGVEQLARAASGSAPAAASEALSPSLPAQLPRKVLEPATFDPFQGVQAAAPVVKPVPVAAAVPAPVAPVTPSAPPLGYRYLGQMVDPEGEQRFYLARAEEVLTVGVGTRLEEGYVVQAIGAEGIRLHYPPLDAHAIIPLPPVPEAAR